ncbi:MAG: DUF1330 domain-containing protein [Alphaproteobacteria bacterium]|nr:DUF1330 domain-containing protein [Alphaproteobacteria bacterium]
MAAYLIAEVTVTNPQGYEAYKPLAAAAIAKHGGRYLVRGGNAEVQEGQPWSRIVVLEFPSMEQARRFYNSPEYQAALPLRKANAASRVTLVEGVPG